MLWSSSSVNVRMKAKKKGQPTVDNIAHLWFSHAAEDTEKVVTSSVQAETSSLGTRITNTAFKTAKNTQLGLQLPLLL